MTQKRQKMAKGSFYWNCVYCCMQKIKVNIPLVSLLFTYNYISYVICIQLYYHSKRQYVTKKHFLLKMCLQFTSTYKKKKCTNNVIIIRKHDVVLYTTGDWLDPGATHQPFSRSLVGKSRFSCSACSAEKIKHDFALAVTYCRYWDGAHSHTTIVSISMSQNNAL